MRVLLVDIGNSRIKWRTASLSGDIEDVLEEGNHALDDEALTRPLWRGLKFEAAVLASVASAPVLAAIEAALAQGRPNLPRTVVHAQVQQCGVKNGYSTPERLGADRWAALIGARALCPDRELVIASYGTATTIDVLESSGQFAGGVILPGFALMREALASGTARLGRVDGTEQLIARDTGDAIASGVMHAQVGALERVVRQLESERAAHPEARNCLLCGGHAGQVLPRLSFAAAIVDNLVLRGLFEIARDTYLPRMQS